MKIIGTTKEGYLLNVNEYELANILGQYSLSQLTTEVNNRIKNGDNIEVSKIYSDFTARESFKQESNVVEARKTLEKMLKLLTPVEVVIREAALNKTK